MPVQGRSLARCVLDEEVRDVGAVLGTDEATAAARADADLRGGDNAFGEDPDAHASSVDTGCRRS
jgi:hypothetical protein